MKRNKLVFALLALSLFSCEKKDMPSDNQELIEYKVAVVLPSSEKADLSKIVDWAQDNIKAAQAGLPSRIELSLEWIDEEGADMQKEVSRVAHDDSYTAIIGPRYSRNARIIARESLSYRIPVLMPSVTSAEFQRIYAGTNMTDPNIFCLSESDISQCMAILSKVRANNYSHVAMLTRDGKQDDYAASFQQNYAYLAREMNMDVDSTYFYEDASGMEEGLRAAVEAQTQSPMPGVLIFVPSSRQDMLDFDDNMGRLGTDLTNELHIVCTDMAFDLSLAQQLKNYAYEGSALGARPCEGFDTAWEARYGTILPGGYAQLYDCFYLLAMAAAASESDPELTVREALLRLTSGNKADTPIYPWTASGMRNAFDAVREGRFEKITGVSGPLSFEEQTHICQMGTTYSTWLHSGGEFVETGHFTRELSGFELWNWTSTQIYDDFDEASPDLEYPTLEDHYAVVIATSTGYNNYRHQADALAQYQMLKGFGYDDDHIILILEDDIVNNSANLHSGVVHVTPDGPDLRAGAVIDYKTSRVTDEDLANIFSGTVTERTPEVVHGSPNTNVFLFWSGHGAHDNLLMWADRNIDSETIKGILEGAEGNYRKMLCVMETCYSGSVGLYCEGLPGILLLCATASGETSHADVLEGNIYLSNRFTRVFREEVEANPDISLHDLYYELATHTTASHAGLYNDACYGNVYLNTMKEYLLFR